MPEYLYIGIDLGTTALKVAAYDAGTGQRVAGKEMALRVITDVDGRREQSPEAIRKSLAKLLGQIASECGGLERVAGIGLASQGGSGIVADRATGKALTPMTLWNDARAFGEYQQIIERIPLNFWSLRTRKDEPGMGLARLTRLRAEAPELLSDKNLYVGAGDYAYFHLTGVWRQDACHALQTGIYDARTNSVSDELAGIVGLSADFFPPLREGNATHPLSKAAAKALGLREGIPVAGPYMDHEAGFLSAAQVSARPMQCSLGTAWVGNFQLPGNATGHTPFQLAIPSPASDGTLVIQPLMTGNVTWNWALENFVGGSASSALSMQARLLHAALLPGTGLVCVPWLNRPHPLDPSLIGGCSFAGLGPSTDRSEMLRAVVAGMGYELHRVFENVASSGVIDSIVLSGGTSQSTHFQQIIAALFAPLPAYVLEDAGWMGTRGCLHAFSPESARAGATPIKLDGSVDRDALAAGKTLYNDVFNRLYGHVRAGSAYTLGEH